mmetsp:Transcript_48336/g.135029  ORF Transcript_48336/g.135029 Transcript_48336/m.135029 type:complete len:518 (-) Transcript_48336:144-1697(-)
MSVVVAAPWIRATAFIFFAWFPASAQAAQVGIRPALRAHTKSGNAIGISAGGGGGPQRHIAYREKMTNNYDVQYTVNVTVGGQAVSMVMDTGSFELLVFSDHCKPCGGTGLYRDAISKTFKDGGFESEHNFGSGTTKSKEAFENIVVGPYTLKHQHFWEVVGADMPILEDDFFHAIMGLGPPRTALKFAEINSKLMHERLDECRAGYCEPRQMNEAVRHFDEVVEHAKEAVAVSEAIGLNSVSICLGRHPGSPGYFVWDDPASEEVPSMFTTLNVVGDVYWSVHLTDVRLEEEFGESEGKALGCTSKNSCTAVLDTGTSLLVAPRDVIDKVQQTLDDWVDPAGDCSDLSGLPNLEFKLNGKLFSLPPESYIGQIDGDVDEDIQRLMPSLKSNSVLDAESCKPLILAADADTQNGQLWILGMPFFRKYYTTFHFSEHGSIAHKVSVAVADEQCRPGELQESQLREEPTAARRSKPLRIDASKLVMPHILRRAAAGVKAPQSLTEQPEQVAPVNPYIGV